jgi:hypothetical protein
MTVAVEVTGSGEVPSRAHVPVIAGEVYLKRACEASGRSFRTCGAAKSREGSGRTQLPARSRGGHEALQTSCDRGQID